MLAKAGIQFLARVPAFAGTSGSANWFYDHRHLHAHSPGPLLPGDVARLAETPEHRRAAARGEEAVRSRSALRRDGYARRLCPGDLAAEPAAGGNLASRECRAACARRERRPGRAG